MKTENRIDHYIDLLHAHLDGLHYHRDSQKNFARIAADHASGCHR